MGALETQKHPMTRLRLLGWGLLGLPFIALPLWQWFSTSSIVKTWIPVEAQVLSVEERIEESEYGRTFTPVIRYSYEVRGRRYESGRVDFMNRESTSDRDECRRFLDRFRPGGSVPAYCDPGDPAQSVLWREAGAQWYLLVFGGGWISLMLWMGRHNAAPPVPR